MNKIRVIANHIIYENPIPNLVSRHGYFPGLVQLPSGDLLTLFAMGEAFEAALTINVSRSKDRGQTWILEGPLYDKSTNNRDTMDNMKPTLLDDGLLIAAGYRYFRDDPETLTNPDTDGLPDGENIISFSVDEGRTWTIPEKMQLSRPEVLENSGPCVKLYNGDVVATATACKLWDGSVPSGHNGIFLKSHDQGRTWDDKTLFFDAPQHNVSTCESRLCEMQPGRIVVIFWAIDEKASKSLPNIVVVSHDNGLTWSDPINTGHQAQASNLIYLGDDRLLTIHAHREDKVGLFVRLVDFRNDRWNVLEEKDIWNRADPVKIRGWHTMGNLKFGQPSLLPLDNGEILAIHWAIEDGQGRIISHRLKLKERT